MTVWTGSSYIYFGVEGKVPETLEDYRYDFDGNFHMTTHFLGKEPLPLAMSATTLALVRLAADKIAPFSMPVKQFKTYGPPEALAMVAIFEAPTYVHMWREEVRTILEETGVQVSKTWPWSPHMTYAYGFKIDTLTAIEEQLVAAKAQIDIVSLEMHDGGARLSIPLTD